MKHRLRARRPCLADKADRHALYQKAVQDAAWECDFIDEQFRALRRRKAYTLREDFCGTANVCCEWVRRRPRNTAIGVDLDPEVLAWGREHNLSALTRGTQARVRLLQNDVCTVRCAPVDMILAMNFSYQIFKSREALCNYFAHARQGLVKDGVLFLDAFGGYDVLRQRKERTQKRGFTYIWDEERYDPITGHLLCHIHFRFPDGSRLDKAFTYDWRLWTLPELQELLHDAGFRNVTVYWQGSDKRTGQPNGIFRPADSGESDPAWIAFIAAEK